jgi:hypothetical protein
VLQPRLSSSCELRFPAGACLAVIMFLAAGCASYGPRPTPGVLSLSVTSLDFKTVVVGQTAQQTLTVSNSGQSPIQLTGLSMSNREFIITGPSVPRTILPANSLSYTISFAPTASGNATGALSISTDSTSASDRVTLAGSGEKAFANLVLTPPAINFGNLKLQSKTSQNVTMQNTGDINVTIQGITLAGAGFGYTSLSPGFLLAPNQRVTFQVWFNPKIAGVAAATISFLSPNLSSPETMALAGDGVTTGSSGHSVRLNWGASTSGVQGYRVYRSGTSGGSYALLTSTLVTGLSFDDTTVSLGTTYYYVVTAVDAAGDESVYSNRATAVIPST